ncbi:hypothetical protein H072_6056 [Dactylellina haptotyla CBS 200.50]|uniref:Uncharacterized protein n=1 Tax=Dactylellina haptotyla (strain CBS 200.50) TaxID=1284197 RepID=S8AB32_DACHA|nr:hypothetical protein H072_6056 [Dactylellina haptotyla CBS 200.50]
MSGNEDKPLQPNQEAFWKAYLFSLKNVILPEPSQDTLFFPAPQNTVGVLAGASPKEVTNYGVYRWCDGVLSPTDPLYSGTGKGSYILNLQEYLNYVDPGGNPDPGTMNDYIQKIELARQAKEGYIHELQQAVEMHKADPGTYPTLEEWATENDPSLLAAKQAWQDAVGAQSALCREVYGEQAGPLNTATQNIMNALSTSSQPGFNMPATMEDVELDEAQSLAIAQGEKVKFPPYTVTYVPTYSVGGGYKSTIATWCRQMTEKTLEPLAIKIDIESYGNTDWEQAGFTQVNGEGFVGFFIGAFATYSRRDEFEKTFNTMTAKDFTCTLTVYGWENFPLEGGRWDVPDVTHIFPNLREDAPKSMMSLIRPSAVAVAYTIGMEVTFEDQFATEFNSHFKSIEEEEGGFTIFGIDIGLGGKRTSQTETTSHKATYDSQSGTLTVIPNNDGHAVLLGVVGNKLGEPKE